MSADLTPFLDALLPGDVHWPSAGSLRLDLWAAAAPLAGYGEALERVAALPGHNPESELREISEQEPAAFLSFQVLAYSCYYTHPKVLAVIEARCGYPARPPQPQGQVIPVTGPDPLPTCAGSLPRWRRDGTEVAERVFAEQSSHPDRTWTKEEIEQWRA